MVLSIIVCTYNRKSFAKLCLESIIKQVNLNTEKKIEIILIDNNSSDNTNQIIEELKNSYEITYHLEKNQGISFARNKGIELSKGEFIAFVDDDAVINDGWLDALINAIKTIPTVCFGGPIYPKFESECPKWIDQSYFIRSYKKTDGFINNITARTGFAGGNMCIHKSVFKKVGTFNISLGMKGNSLGLGEEPEFFYRIFKSYQDKKLYNLNMMSITHFEANQKTEKKYLKERIVLSGLQFSFKNIKEQGTLGFLIILLKILKQSFDILIYLIANNKFRYLKSLWTIKGLIKGIFSK